MLPVLPVAGTAVCDSPRVRPVIVVPLTHVNETHSRVDPSLDFRRNLHLVTVGAVATVILVSAAESLAARYVINLV